MKKNARRAGDIIKKSDVFSTDRQLPFECVFADMSERLLKIQRDLIMPAVIFEKNKIQNTVTIFGSSRIRSAAAAKAELEKIKKNPKAKDYREKLRRAKNVLAMSKYYTAAEELARRLQEWVNISNVPEDEKFHIMTGGGPGIMEASSRGAFSAGGTTVGATISIGSEIRNEYVDKGVWFNFNYFLMRKFWLIFFAKAIVVFPGGVGTLDELFEVLTLIKTRKTHKKIPMVLFGKSFWQKAINFKALLDADVVTQSDVDLIKYADTVDDAFNHIISIIKK